MISNWREPFNERHSLIKPQHNAAHRAPLSGTRGRGVCANDFLNFFLTPQTPSLLRESTDDNPAAPLHTEMVMACASTFRRLSRSLSSAVVLLRIKTSSLRSCVSMFCLAHWSNNRASYSGTVSNTCAVILCASVYVCLSRGGGGNKKKKKSPPTLDEWLVVGGERGTGLPY